MDNMFGKREQGLPLRGRFWGFVPLVMDERDQKFLLWNMRKNNELKIDIIIEECTYPFYNKT